MGLPDEYKVRRGVGKWIVRQWAHDMIPAYIIARRKWGFRVPLAQWFRGPMREMLYGRLTGADGLVARYGNPVAIKNLVDAHCSGRIDASEPLWTLLTAEIWFSDVYLERVGQRNREPVRREAFAKTSAHSASIAQHAGQGPGDDRQIEP